MTKIQELGSSLQKLLSTLKKNRKMIPLEVLKSHYQQPYYALIREINKNEKNLQRWNLGESGVRSAYSVTLDLVIDEIERRIRDNQIGATAESDGNPRVVIIIEDGIISTVLASAPGVQIDIIELDRNYADSKLRSSTYDAILKEPGLQNCNYSLHVPGYAQETEVDE